MHTDDELRQQLHRERARRGPTRSANGVLTDLRPAMRRARRRRLATATAAATMALGGLVAVAQVVRNDPDLTIRTSTDAGQTDTGQTVTGPTVTGPTVTGPTVTGPTVTGPTVTTPDGVPVSTHRAEVAEFDVQPVETIATGVPGSQRGADAAPVITGLDGNTVVSPEPTTSAPHGDDDSDDSDDSAGPPPPATATSTVPSSAPSSTIAAQPSNSTTVPPSTTPAAETPERFESECGYALAIRTAQAVDVIEIVPVPGYQYSVEDPDRGAITIQFTGSGEDCELKIPTVSGGSGS